MNFKKYIGVRVPSETMTQTEVECMKDNINRDDSCGVNLMIKIRRSLGKFSVVAVFKSLLSLIF